MLDAPGSRTVIEERALIFATTGFNDQANERFARTAGLKMKTSSTNVSTENVTKNLTQDDDQSPESHHIRHDKDDADEKKKQSGLKINLHESTPEIIYALLSCIPAGHCYLNMIVGSCNGVSEQLTCKTIPRDPVNVHSGF